MATGQHRLIDPPLLGSSSFLELADQAALDGAWDIDLNTDKAILSKSAYTLLDHSPEDIPVNSAFQTWFMSRIHPQDVKNVKAAAINHWKRQTPFKVEFRFLRSNDHYHWLMAKGQSNLDPHGKPFRFTGYLSDIHHQKRTEHALRVSELRLKEAQSLARMGNWELDLITNTLHWSPQIYAIFELDPVEFGASYESFLNIIHPEDRDKVNKAYQHSVRDRTHYTITHRLLMNDGRIKYVEENGETIYDADLKPLRSIGTVQDITEIKNAENELRKLNEDLELRVKERTQDLEQARDAALAANQAKSDFLSRVSHELRTPLTGILGFSKLLQMSNLPGRDGQNASRIHQAGEHLLDLINEMLDLSRIESGTLSLAFNPVNISDLMNEMTGLVEPMAKGFGISVHLDLPKDLEAWVHVDRQRLRQVLWNLASNGVKYNQKNGTLTFSVETAANDRLQILVKDTGKGIPDNKMHRLFSPFDRLDIESEDPNIEGTGLGLSLCKRLVEAMKGSISATSKLGEGTTFLVEFDLAKEQANPEEN